MNLNELTIDLLILKVSGDWWRGSVSGREGLIPDKYILLKIRYAELSFFVFMTGMSKLP